MIITVLAALAVYSCGSDDPAAPRTEDGPDGWWTIEATVRTLRGIYDPATGGTIAVGDGGMILRREASGWVSMESPVTASLNAICGAPSGSIWAVGNSGTILE